VADARLRTVPGDWLMNKTNHGAHDPSQEASARKESSVDSQSIESVDTDAADLPETESVAADRASRQAPPQPEAIGTYRVLRVLGEGGMGRVFLCEQANPKRQVAVKVMLSRLSQHALRRFQLEAETLARLHHAGIAQIFEAGYTVLGGQQQPFIAMELVEGHNINCERIASWNTPAKIRLMIKVCRAVEHAHQNGVLHRDLKPGNILVSDTDEPKILDFGLAREIDRGDSELPGQTEAGQILGTLAYMSPEQASGDPLAVDTRSDVYSLGVVAYQLLSRQLPIPVSRESLLESLQSIRDREPTPLGKLNRACRGDLETIVDKALEKEKEHRYQSVAELRTDFERHLQYMPIIARHASVWQRLHKFVQRHRALVTASTITLVTILTSLVIVSLLLYRTQQANATITQRNHELTVSRATEHTARREAVGRLAETYVLSARIAARRGQWREAIELYDNALAMDQPDPRALQVERVRLLAAIGKRTEALGQIAALQSKAVGRPGAVMDLLHGELLMYEWSNPEKALGLIQGAVDSGNLEQADEEYARGLMTDNTVQACQHFHKAVALNPFHQQARMQLAQMLLFLGRWEEARQEIAVAKLLFPDDEMAIGMEATIDFLGGQQERAITTIKELAPKIGQRTSDAVVAILQQIGPLLQKVDDPDAEIGVTDLLLCYGQIVRIFVQYSDVFTSTSGKDILLSMPNHPVLRRWASMRSSLVMSLTFRRYKQLADDMLKIAEGNPVDLPYALAAFCHLEMARNAANTASSDQARVHAELASDLFEKAVNAPSMLSAATRATKMGWVDADMTIMDLLPMDSEARAERQQQALANLHRFAKEDALGVEQLSFYAQAAFVLDDLEAARGLLQRWRQRDPKDLQSVRMLAAVEGKMLNYYQAIVLADEVLTSQPKDDAMLKLREGACEQLQNQAVAVMDRVAPRSQGP
jgi:serine/threonine protein kinase